MDLQTPLESQGVTVGHCLSPVIKAGADDELWSIGSFQRLLSVGECPRVSPLRPYWWQGGAQSSPWSSHPRSQRLNVELTTALSAVKSSLRWGESPSPRARQEKPTSTPRPGFCHFLWPVTQCQAWQSRFLSHNVTLVVTQGHAWLSRFFQLREENRIMEPHLVLKWGSHLHHELGALFLKHNHEW